ncbi:MAG: TMEM165/GDT1 family protein [Pseudanabaenaceae cyanobacterium]
MNWELFVVCFVTIFISELGDKSQLVTFTMTSNSRFPWYIFIGSASALILTSGLGVLLGDGIAYLLPDRPLKALAALLFAFLAFRTLAD